MHVPATLKCLLLPYLFGLAVNVWLQLISTSLILPVQAQSLSKINELNSEEQIINMASAGSSAPRWNFRSKLPLFNVSGTLTLHSIESLDSCNRTFRIQMNQWFLDECSNSNAVVCKRKRSIHFPTSSDLFRDYLSKGSSSKRSYSSEEMFEMALENAVNSKDKDSLDESAGLFGKLQKRNHQNENHGNNPFLIGSGRHSHLHIAQQAQDWMDKCCRLHVNPICTESFLRSRFQDICAPNRIVTKEVFRS